MLSHHRSPTRPDNPEKVSVGDETQPLVPRVIGRGEVGVDVVVGTQPVSDTGEQELLHLLRLGAGLSVDEALPEHVLATDDCVGQLGGQEALESVGDGIRSGPGHHIGGGALHHRDMGGVVGHCRHQSHRRGPRADHHDAFACVVEVLRPVLRVHDGSFEPLPTPELRSEAFPVAVVAGAHEQEPTGQGDRDRGA